MAAEKLLTLNEEHFQHRRAGVQQDGLAFADDGERALLRGRLPPPGEPGRPHVDVEEVCVILQRQTNGTMFPPAG